MPKVSKTPLVVDLDGTLIKSDSLIEALIAALFAKPSMIVAAMRALCRSRFALKEYIAEIGIIDAEKLPLRPEVVEFLQMEKARGREIHLATAAHQSVADAVAARLGLFTSTLGSWDGVNLKGLNKLDALKERFPAGFAYAGNDRSDLDVWRGASSVVLVSAKGRTRRAALNLGVPVEREFPGEMIGLRGWLKALRIHQWSKNLLLFVPLILAHQYDDLSVLARTCVGFVGLGLLASGTYLLNDLSDVDADRIHATKSNRAIARGAIAAQTALAAAFFLIMSGLAVGLLGCGPAFFALQIVYLVLTVSYSLRLKKVAMLDVSVLGGLYTLRVFMGTALVGTETSPWLLAFSLFLFCSLSMAKRHVEIVRAVRRGSDKIEGRDYFADDAPLTLSFGIAASQSAVLIFFLYIANDAYPVGAYKDPRWLWLIGFCIFLWTGRVWLLSHRGELDDDPVIFALKDFWSLFLGAVVIVLFAMATTRPFY